MSGPANHKLLKAGSYILICRMKIKRERGRERARKGDRKERERETHTERESEREEEKLNCSFGSVSLI